MKNEKLDEFLYKNRLKSSDLVEYWGVTKGVVSQILNGTTKLPTKRLEELLNNPNGWDVSMLTDRQPENAMVETPETSTIVDKLFALIEDARADNRMLLAMLKEKDEKIDALQEELRRFREKGETARIAKDSSTATAV